MEDFAIFARGVFGEIFPSSLPVLTGANNTTIEISVRKITIRQKTSDSLWRIGHMCSIEKESSELYWGLNFFFFLLQTWVKILSKWFAYQKIWWYSMLKILMEKRQQKWLMLSVYTIAYSMETSHVHIISIFIQRTEVHTDVTFY